MCTSVNNCVCHGIPDDRPLVDGDIINVDITVYLDGYHGDCSKTFLVGNVDEKGKKLVQVFIYLFCASQVKDCVYKWCKEICMLENMFLKGHMFYGHDEKGQMSLKRQKLDNVNRQH